MKRDIVTPAEMLLFETKGNRYVEGVCHQKAIALLFDIDQVIRNTFDRIAKVAKIELSGMPDELTQEFIISELDLSGWDACFVQDGDCVYVNVSVKGRQSYLN